MSSHNQDQNVEVRCWHCERATDTLLCTQCGKIQPPSQKNFFALLGLPASFSLDLGYLENKYLQLQQLIHPDRFVGKSVREKRYASQQSSLVNQAFETLKDPIQRGYYLLKILDKNYREDEKQTYDDQEFLMTLLMEQESIESTTDLEEIQINVQHGKEKSQSYAETIRQAFEDENLEAAQSYLSRYQYQQTLIDKAMQKSSQLRN
jgi:molecular chaperone HscB